MAETEYITVAEVSDGPGGTGDPGTEVSLPVVELLTGRGFVTGKSGSGKSNSASVIAEKLLDNGFGLLIVDIDGEYYGLKEEYEILHVGADDECDIQITADHAEKMASLALEQNVPIILDVSSFLDAEEAEAVLTEVARHLFAKAKKQKQPFLLLVEEVHEYIPEGGSVGECGQMLIKIGKRGRKHGLGICGISQRPADVKKDFITQCDWLVWHRLTWDNDTKVVRRVLDGEYAGAVEDLDDGEAFMTTDWSEGVERVQFYRKRTFDAGATPGLEDFERPELKSVSDDLVSELQEISDEQQEREDRIAELREELDRKNSRIAELERELQDARDLSRMADQFVDALVRHVQGANPGRTEQERMREQRDESSVGPIEMAGTDADAGDSGSEGAEPAAGDPDGGSAGGEDKAFAAVMDAAWEEANPNEPEDDAATANDDAATTGANDDTATANAENGDSRNGSESGFSAAETLERLRSVGTGSFRSSNGSNGHATGADGGAGANGGGELRTGSDAASTEPDGGAGEAEPPAAGDEIIEDDGILDADVDTPPEFTNGIEGDGPPADPEAEIIDGQDGDGAPAEIDRDSFGTDEPLVVRELKADIGGMETKARKMLAFYREFGPGTPLNAHFAAGGDGDRTDAYAHNRTLRTRGLIEHVGRGRYDYRLRDLLREEFDGHVDEGTIDRYAENVESKALEGESVDPDPDRDPDR